MGKQMQTSTVEVTITAYLDGYFHVTAVQGKNLLVDAQEKIAETNYTVQWIFTQLRPILRRVHEYDLKITIQVGEAKNGEVLFQHSLLEQFIVYLKNLFEGAIANTRKLLGRWRHCKEQGINWPGLLVYAMDNDVRMKGFCEHYRDKTRTPIYFESYESGWDTIANKWTDACQVMAPNELIAYCEQHNIGTVITSNFYLEHSYFYSHQIYLPAVWFFLGIRHIGLDNDLWEIQEEHLLGMFQEDDGFHFRYTALPYFGKHWVGLEKTQNVFYQPLFQHYQVAEQRKILAPEYSVAVLSMSRTKAISQSLFLILRILEDMKSDLPIKELHLWQLALREYILRKKGLRLDEIKRMTSRLFLFAYYVANFLKYETIHSIKGDITVMLYGDENWKVLFPEYYIGYLDGEQREALYKKDDILYLTFNTNFNYLECGGPISDMIGKGLPFLSWSALVRTPSFNGMKHIEYQDSYELNYRIRNARELLAEEELGRSIQRIEEVFEVGEAEMAAMILEREMHEIPTGYERICLEHEKLVRPQVEQYLQASESILSEHFSLMFVPGQTCDFDVTRSRYWGRPYLQRLLEWMRANQNASNQ